MFWVKNSIMFNSLITVYDRMLNHFDFLQFWKFFDLTRILINLLKFYVFYEICMFFTNLLSVFLYLLENFIVCYCCEQFINTWEFIVLNWIKMNFVVRTVLFFSIENWLKTFWEKLSQIVSQNVSFCVVIETADDWLKSVWKKLSWIFLSSFIDIVEASAYLYDLIE